MILSSPSLKYSNNLKGNVTLSLATASAGVVGNSTILNMTIAPGNNTLPMTTIIDQTKVISSMDSEGFVEMLITGTSSVYNGQHITYYVSTLSFHKQHITLTAWICRRKLWRPISSL